MENCEMNSDNSSGPVEPTQLASQIREIEEPSEMTEHLKNTSVETEEFQERAECRTRARTEKGLQYDLEIAWKKKNQAIRNLGLRMKAINESLKNNEDIVKLTAAKDGLEIEANGLRVQHESVMDLLFKLDLTQHQETETAKYRQLNDLCLECLADVKTRIKDLELERAELVSQRSGVSRKSYGSARTGSSSSSKRAAVEAASLRAKMKSLIRRQEIDRRQRELERQQSELKWLDEQERLQGEINAAEAIRQILQTSDAVAGPSTSKEEVTSTVSPTAQFSDASLSKTTTPGIETNLGPVTGTNTDHKKLPSSNLNVYSTPFIPMASVPETVMTAMPNHSDTQQILQLQQIHLENAEIQKRQIDLLRKITLPVLKPPVFSGNILEYPRWENAFNALVEKVGVEPAHKLYYLGEYTSRAAGNMISGLLGLQTVDAYQRARQLLKERYGDAFRIYEAYREKLKNWPICSTSTELQQYSDFLIMTRETMKSVKYLKEFDSFSCIQELAARFPTHYANKWRENAKRVDQMKGDYLFADFVEFAQEASTDASHPVFSYDALNATRRELEKGTGGKDANAKQNRTRPDRGRYRSTALSTLSTEHQGAQTRIPPSPNKSSCTMCDQPHPLEKCKAFLAKSVKEREEFCKAKGICFSCLQQGHIVRYCKRKVQCEVCKRSHTTVLHRTPDREKGVQGSNEIERATNNCVNCSETTTSMILPVWICHKEHPGRKIKVYAILDDQSDTCFMTCSLRDDLGASGPDVVLELGTMHAVKGIKAQRITGLVGSRYDSELDIDLPKVYTRDHIPGRHSQIPRPETAERYKHLSGIAAKIPPYDESLRIGLLIGNNCVRAIKPRDMIPGNSTDPYAIRTALGWDIVGAKTRDDCHDYLGERAACQRIATREVGGDERAYVQFTSPERYKEVLIPLHVKRMFEQDFPEAHDDEKSLSQEDMKFMKMMTDRIHKTEDGHYEMPLPLRSETIDLPCNRRLAEARLRQLKTRFTKDAKYKRDYMAFMQDMLDKGYAERAPGDSEKAWYIPHHGVSKEA